MGLFFFLVLSLRYFDLALVVFVMAMTTDFLDGYLARRNGQISDFGRIADPLVDKVIICGGFFLLLFHLPMVKPWMVITVVSRELLISLLRGYAELKGFIFPSNLCGKVKMTFQSFTVGLLVLSAGHSPGPRILWGTEGLLWLTLVLTVLSGLSYLVQAWQFFCRGGSASGGCPPPACVGINETSSTGLTGHALSNSPLAKVRCAEKPYGVL
jgi:CDP-diacylglycerol--glycerol-3-phosphate 3-phosphatidyltransferase